MLLWLQMSTWKPSSCPFSELTGELSDCKTRTTQTVSLSHHNHLYINEPQLLHTDTHTAPLTTPVVGASTHKLLVPLFFSLVCFSNSHLCLAVGHKVGLCWQEVLAVAVASGAMELVWLQHGTLRPLVSVGLPPAHRLSCDCVGTVR